MYKLYSRLSDHETVLELWGASTKHPDSVFFFSNFKPSDWFEPKDQIIPWIFECASKLNMPSHSYELAKWACDIYEESIDKWVLVCYNKCIERKENKNS